MKPTMHYYSAGANKALCVAVELYGQPQQPTGLLMTADEELVTCETCLKWRHQ